MDPEALEDADVAFGTDSSGLVTCPGWSVRCGVTPSATG
jgi:hypothetical protein